MEWQLVLLIILASLVVIMLTGMPVAFCFMLINTAGMYLYFGGGAGLEQLINSIYSSLNSFIVLMTFSLIGVGSTS